MCACVCTHRCTGAHHPPAARAGTAAHCVGARSGRHPRAAVDGPRDAGQAAGGCEMCGGCGCELHVGLYGGSGVWQMWVRTTCGYGVHVLSVGEGVGLGNVWA